MIDTSYGSWGLNIVIIVSLFAGYLFGRRRMINKLAKLNKGEQK